jgi:hypothetical protein
MTSEEGGVGALLIENQTSTTTFMRQAHGPVNFVRPCIYLTNVSVDTPAATACRSAATSASIQS